MKMSYDLIKNEERRRALMEIGGINGEESACLKIFSLVWMFAGLVVMFIVACVCCNALLIVNNMPSTVYEKPYGWCYYVDKRNMTYMDVLDIGANNLVILGIDDDDYINITGDNTTDEDLKMENDYSSPLVKINHNGSVTFFAGCGTSFYRPSENTNTTWRLESPYRRVCGNTIVRHAKQVATNVWMENNKRGAFTLDKCKFDYVESEEEFNVRFHSCCAFGDRSELPEDCLDGLSLDKKQCLKNWFGAGDVYESNACSRRVKTYEFEVEELVD